MPHWLIKSAVHRVIGLMPYRRKLNDWLQNHVTKSLELGKGAFEARIIHAQRLLEDFRELRPECAEGFTVLEVGTGWYPAVVIGLYLCGAGEIWTFDIEPLLRREHLKQLLNYFCEYDVNGELARLLLGMRPERMKTLRAAVSEIERETPEAWLARFNIRAVVADARNTGLPEGTVDFFFSSGVLQYISAEVQSGLLAEFHRIGRPGAVLIQSVNLKDQYWNFDPSITPFNYLRFSAAQWRWLDSPLIPQTRLRVTDYRKLLAKGGFEIVKEINASGSPGDLEKIRLAPEFQKYSKEDLLVTDAWQVARCK
jgi:SAM-dependent methyltransferase